MIHEVVPTSLLICDLFYHGV